MQNLTPAAIAAVMVELAPAVAFAFAAERVARMVQRWPAPLRVFTPAALVVPYVIVGIAEHTFRWDWFTLYAGLPIAVAALLWHASVADPEQRGNWRDAFVLLVLGLAVDLRWFEAAWPPGWRALNEMLLVDIGLYGFLAIRQLSGTGFNFRLKASDFKTGLRELVFFAPIVVALGLALHFIHPHRNLPGIGRAIGSWMLIFLFTAVPEELFFRAWVQNLLERRVGRRFALVLASVVFGLSHFNKRSAHFNWSYVALATIAGIFYGRAWRENRRVPASSITHASVDWLWSWWF
jgi:uncharacterized protein